MSSYERFYLGKEGTRIGGHMLDDILDNWSDTRLEHNHTYVQYAFPTPRLSEAQPEAVDEPLTEAIAKRMKDDPYIMRQYDRMVTRMLSFWGMERIGADGVEVVNPTRFQGKLGKANHNQLRMTRVLTSLKCFGMVGLMDSLKATLAHNVSGQSVAMKHWMGV